VTGKVIEMLLVIAMGVLGFGALGLIGYYSNDGWSNDEDG
jgi:hypothetical protein